MKNYNVRIGRRVATVIAVIGMSALAAAAAQNLTVYVPFDFTAGGTEFQAGEIKVSFDAPTAGSMMIQATKGRSSAIVLSRPMHIGQAVEAPTAVFNVYGEKRFLSRILTGDGNGRAVSPNTTEIKMARSTDSSKVASVEVAAEVAAVPNAAR